MDLSHYSEAELIEPVNVQQGEPGARWDKPRGLWVSVDGPIDWHEWASENYHVGPWHHRVALADTANILYIDSVSALREFTAEYGILETGLTFHMRVDWPRVSEKWQGIIIAPYHWAVRGDMDLFWYYTWDCASGCVWDASAIESVTLLGETRE